MADQSRAETVENLCAAFSVERGGLLPLLHAIQHAIGHVPDEAVLTIAAALNLSRADVHGIITFYHDFRRAPAGRHVIKLCRAESCQARGGADIERAATDRLGMAMGETSPDGRITIEAVYCLGLCATGPNALVDGVPVSRIDAARLDRLLQAVAA